MSQHHDPNDEINEIIRQWIEEAEKWGESMGMFIEEVFIFEPDDKGVQASDADSPFSANQWHDCHPCSYFRGGVCEWMVKEDTPPPCF